MYMIHHTNKPIQHLKQRASLLGMLISVTYISGSYKSVLHEFDPGRFGADVIKAVCGLECLVYRMMHDSGWQCIEAHEVCDATFGILK